MQAQVVNTRFTALRDWPRRHLASYCLRRGIAPVL